MSDETSVERRLRQHVQYRREIPDCTCPHPETGEHAEECLWLLAHRRDETPVWTSLEGA